MVTTKHEYTNWSVLITISFVLDKQVDNSAQDNEHTKVKIKRYIKSNFSEHIHSKFTNTAHGTKRPKNILEKLYIYLGVYIRYAVFMSASVVSG